MKLDHHDQENFENALTAQRDAFSKRLDDLSDLAIEKLGTNEENAQLVVESVHALGPLLADIVVWTEAAVACDLLLAAGFKSAPTMATVAALMQRNADMDIGPLPLDLMRPAYDKLVSGLRTIDKAGSDVESLCAEIDDGAWDRFRDGDDDTIKQVTVLTVMRAIGVLKAHGFESSEQVTALRDKVRVLGLDPDEVGLPKVWPEDFGVRTEIEKFGDTDLRAVVRGPATMSRDAFMREAVQQIASATGIELDADHLREVAPGHFVFLVSEDGNKSVRLDGRRLQDETQREVELDGGAVSGTPRVYFPDAPEGGAIYQPVPAAQPRHQEHCAYEAANRPAVPDDADGVDRAATTTCFPLNVMGSPRYPYAPRNFGRRAAD